MNISGMATAVLMAGALTVPTGPPTTAAPVSGAAPGPPVVSAVAGGPTSVHGVLAAKRRPKKRAATLTVTYTIRADGKVVVQLTSNASKVQIKYRTAKNKKKSTTRKIKKGRLTVVLPAGSKKITARTKSTKKLAASPWILAALPAPPVQNPTSPTPPVQNPPVQESPVQEPPVDTTAPGAVTGLTVAGVTSTSITLTWSNPTDPDLAAVTLTRDGATIYTGLASTFTDFGLAPSRPYEYTATTRDTAANSSVAVVVTGRTASSTDLARVSVASDGEQANHPSGYASVSANGRYVAFESMASNLVTGDTNGAQDIFVHDRRTGSTTRITGLGQANGDCHWPTISGDGRYVSFDSEASNLVAGDTNGVADAFLFDRQTTTLTRISVSTAGIQANGDSAVAAISTGGRYIAYYSAASNLVAGDTNTVSDVFLYDRQTALTTRISVATDGGQANFASMDASISADGRYVAFVSQASNLVVGDTNGATDVFVHDRQTATTTRVSVATDGTQPNLGAVWPVISGDGRYVTFSSAAPNLVADDTNSASDVFRHDRQTGSTTRISVAPDGTQANAGSDLPAISADGRSIAFHSLASNLVAADTNAYADVFVAFPVPFDLTPPGPITGLVISASPTSLTLSWTNPPDPDLDAVIVTRDDAVRYSAAGTFFTDTGLAPDTTYQYTIVVRDTSGNTSNLVLATGQTTPLTGFSRVSVSSQGSQADNASGSVVISANGRYAAFFSLASNLVAGDTNGVGDVFVRDRQTGSTTRVSVASNGTQATAPSRGPAISADGRYVIFESEAANLVGGDTNSALDVFLHDRQTASTTRISVGTGGTQATGASGMAAITGSGRYVAYYSVAPNLVAGDSNNAADVFLFDGETATTSRVSVAPAGAEPNGSSYAPSISDDGRFVSFTSAASNLVTGDTNGAYDVFLHDRQTATTTRVSVATGGAQTDGSADASAISGDGRYIAFHSSATNIVGGDTNSALDVFVHDRQTSTTSRVSVASGSTQGDGRSQTPAISTDGRYITFYSDAANLVTSDTNNAPDVFLRDRVTGTTIRIPSTIQANGASYAPSISGDGRTIAFESFATNLVPGDTNKQEDVFVAELP